MGRAAAAPPWGRGGQEGASWGGGWILCMGGWDWVGTAVTHWLPLGDVGGPEGAGVQLMGVYHLDGGVACSRRVAFILARALVGGEGHGAEIDG
jgi:hypothetical protein